MTILLHKTFERGFKKLRKIEKEKFKTRRDMFLKNPFHPVLNNHSLHGKYQGYRSINITGNLRVVYKEIDAETYLFVEIGTHAKLYE